MSINPSLGLALTAVNVATPLPNLPNPKPASKLAELLASGALTPPLSDMEGLIYVTTATEAARAANTPLPRDVAEFSRRDAQVWVVAEWQKKGRISKGVVSSRIYDVQNRLRLNVPPKKVSLTEAPTRYTFGFTPAGLEAGIYRIDLLWDNQPVWRTLIRVAE
jgi:hypothetical protein